MLGGCFTCVSVSIITSSLSQCSRRSTRFLTTRSQKDTQLLLRMANYSESHSEVVRTFSHHSDSCRSLAFTKDNKHLISVGADRSINVVDIEAGSCVMSKKNAHDDGINVVRTIDANIFTTGDDDGEVKVWDARVGDCVMKNEEHEDYISDMVYHQPKRRLLATSGDGALSVYDMRKSGKIEALSECLDDELLSVVVMKDGKKVVCGTQDGVLDIFNWEQFGDISDRLPGHPESVSTMLKIDEDTLLTGSSDGLVRAIQIHPNKLIGVLAMYDFPIEKLGLSQDNKYLATSTHDNCIHFANIGYLFEDDDDDEEEEVEEEGMAPAVARVVRTPAGGAMEEEEADESDSDFSSEDEDQPVSKAAALKEKIERSTGSNFFSDL
eukprot:GCRY01001079.1.p1 GENE.GCRY01001079.1~~GCRY01001079.1.p1  ORF type:complete len:381 (+),score=100.40 GCRY01001079.1:133-1275(+)